jgi:hypothetical protein
MDIILRRSLEKPDEQLGIQESNSWIFALHAVLDHKSQPKLKKARKRRTNESAHYSKPLLKRPSRQ